MKLRLDMTLYAALVALPLMLVAGCQQTAPTVPPVTSSATAPARAPTPLSEMNAETVRQALAGDIKAQRHLGNEYSIRYFSTQNPADHVEASTWLRRAADGGDVEAIGTLGMNYLGGLGVPRDPAEAVRLFRLAAEQGDERSQYNLGMAYHNGTAVPRDYAEALIWLRKAAENKNTRAQRVIGTMYANGRGVATDRDEAAAWLRRAAIAGDEAAPRDLGRMYFRMRSTPQDDMLAYYWFRRGTGLMSDADFVTAVEARDLVAKRLTLGQFDHVEALLRQGRATAETEARVSAGVAATAARPGPRLRASGTGFRIGGENHVLTTHRFIENCAEVRVGGTQPVSVVARDLRLDIALLKLAAGTRPDAPFRAEAAVAPGTMLQVVGYTGPSLSMAINWPMRVTGAEQIGGALELLRLRTGDPVSDGGPLVDESGAVAGMMSYRHSQLLQAQREGQPQGNANFAVRSDTLRAFLDANGVRYRTLPTVAPASPPVWRDMQGFREMLVVRLECWV